MNGYRSLNSSQSGFTLIELLIVVAIISILSAIAVPNFLEAQTRSKVSRERADLKSIASGLETYRVDNNAYPWVGDPAYPAGAMSTFYKNRLKVITTPIAYMSIIPDDVFAKDPSEEPRDTGYAYAPGNIALGVAAKFNKAVYRNTIYSVSGRGPDRDMEFGQYCLNHPEMISRGYPEKGSYDPTNGTISGGDVVQLSCGRL